MIRARVPIVKILASAVTLGTGGSGGREGPIAQIGSGFGAWFGTALRLPPRERRILVLAGAAGGVGAIFRAPLGGALVICELLYWNMEFEYLRPALGGLLTGLLGLVVPQTVGLGYGWLQLGMLGQLSAADCAAGAVGKILATGFTISSGGSGGVFGPAVVIGGFTGGAIGRPARP